MTKETKVRPIIQALADWAVDDALASHDAGVTFRPDRKRLGRKSEHMAAVKTLHSKLAAAAEANAAVRAIEAQAQQLRVNGSDGLPRLSWPELGEESPTRANKLSSWTRQVESYLGPIAVAAKIRKRLLRN